MVEGQRLIQVRMLSLEENLLYHHVSLTCCLLSIFFSLGLLSSRYNRLFTELIVNTFHCFAELFPSGKTVTLLQHLEIGGSLMKLQLELQIEFDNFLGFVCV